MKYFVEWSDIGFPFSIRGVEDVDRIEIKLVCERECSRDDEMYELLLMFWDMMTSV